MGAHQLLTKKYTISLLPLCVLGGLLLAAPTAQAFFGIPFEASSMALDALDFVDNTVLQIFVWLALLAGGAAIFITISAHLLDWSSSMPIDLDNTLVTTGWDFVSGFVNMIFILIFVGIAFSYIFRIENLGMKKALPRLIVIAFLVNFSLLFVKIFVDIGWIVQNSFKGAFGGGMAQSVAGPLVDALMPVAKEYMKQLGVYVGLGLVPFANVIRLVYFATAFLFLGFLNTLSQIVILIVFGFVGGTVFLAYTILFLMRVVIIWMLAIAAPLAFVAFILPSTQKYFHQWFRYLLEWSFLGVVVFFLMGLGMKLFGGMAPGHAPFEIGITGSSWSFTEEYAKFIFLIIYLLIVLHLSKKFVPTGMNFVWDWGEKMTLGSGKLASRLTRKAGWKTKVWGAEKTAAMAERLERTGGVAERPARWWARGMGGAERLKKEAEFLRTEVETRKAAERRGEIMDKLPKDPAAQAPYLSRLLRQEKSAIRPNKEKMDNIKSLIDEKRPDLARYTAEIIDPKNVKKMIDEEMAKGVSKDIAEIRTSQKLTEDAMKKMDPEDFRKNVRTEAFKDVSVVYNLMKDEGKFREIEQKGKMEVKTMIKEMVQKNPYFLPENLSTEDQPTINRRAGQLAGPEWTSVSSKKQPRRKQSPRKPDTYREQI